MQNEDKIIGGYISIRQLMWLLVPMVVFVKEFLIDRSYILNSVNEFQLNEFKVLFKSLYLIAAIVMGVTFAFVNLSGLKADKFFLKLLMFKSRKKIIKYERR